MNKILSAMRDTACKRCQEGNALLMSCTNASSALAKGEMMAIASLPALAKVAAASAQRPGYAHLLSMISPSLMR